MLSNSPYGCPIELTLFSFTSCIYHCLVPALLPVSFIYETVGLCSWNSLEGNLANQKYYNLVG